MNGRKRETEPLGIVLIHGSSVTLDQRALVFLGPSGTGKTTISRLLKPTATVIGDDRLYLIPKGSSWEVADATARAREGALTEEEARSLAGIPLGAVFRLFQAAKHQIIPLNSRQTCYYLTKAFYELHYWSCHLDAQAQANAFSHLADIARKTPGFELYFEKSTEIADEIRRAIS